MTDNNDRFKLVTRRYLAWGLGSAATFGLLYVVIWSVMFETGCGT